MPLAYRRILIGLVATALIAGAAACLTDTSESIADLIVAAHAAIQQRDNATAQQLAERILEQQPDHPEGLMLWAVAAAEQGKLEESLEHCRRVARSAEVYVDARCMAGNICLDAMGRISDAEKEFRMVLEADSDNLTAHDRLAHLLSLQTRTRELISHQLTMLRSGSLGNRVFTLARGDLLYPDPQLIERLRRTDPDSAGLILAEARHSMFWRDYPAAVELLKQAVQINPELIEGHARLGRAVMEAGSDTEIQDWYSALPATALNHPGICNTLGQLASQHGQPHEAARCHWEAVRGDPNLATANYQLGQVLIKLDRASDAKPFLDRAERLQQYAKALDPGAPPPAKPVLTNETLHRAAELAESLGLIWEAYAWSEMACHATRPPSWALTIRQRLKKRLPELSLERHVRSANPANKIDLREYPWPEFSSPAISPSDSQSVEKPTPVRFRSDAAVTGLNFQYNNGSNENFTGRARPYDFTGGGVAVLDFDVDAWPDVYFAQGCNLNDTSHDSASVDRLFRNHDGRRFNDVTFSAGIREVDFSQGVAIGDFDNDGFPDLFVGNLGRNRLLHNNGDGTFSDLSKNVTGDANRWTTSCLVCDLNADGWPDLYSVNYLSGDIRTIICRDETGAKESCAPQSLPASQDQIHLNTGDGSFHDVTGLSGIELPGGKGLGIVAGDFNGDRLPDLFVANDGVANHFFKNVTAPGATTPQFLESAVELGLALNREGNAEACMGIAADDFDGDGQTDLFVTNFIHETNTLYRHDLDSLYFDDVTRQSTLGIPSIRLLGFGTQSIDGELDGLPDLIITNGHVDDYRFRELPYQMPPQYFRNTGDLQFEEISGPGVSDYFQGEYLGRAMARLDWDRNGAEDIIITHLEQPVALLTNTTPSRGHFCAIRLHAVSTSRDAVGATVTVNSGGRRLTRQLTNGDGYQASNEQMLVFGLGDSSQVDDLNVLWPSGREDHYSNLPADSEYHLIEGAPRVMTRLR